MAALALAMRTEGLQGKAAWRGIIENPYTRLFPGIQGKWRSYR